MHTLINTYLDQYFITDVAGRGSMATVYKALQPSLNRSVAIKVLAGRLNPYARLRFEREARAIALLQHPNILPIYDFVQHDEIDYFVMQYVDPAVSLNDYIANGPLALTKSLHLVSRVLDALEYAHSHGVIHRDIKPSNILMSRDDWPLLADFGIAKMLDDSQQLTPVGQVIGTASYMAPEVTQSHSVDARSDIYSIGIVLYEMMTGRVPFDGASAIGVLMKHVNEPLPPPSSINPLIPPLIEAIVGRALDKDPAKRYQSAADMGVAIRTALVQIERSTRQISVTRPTPVLTPALQPPSVVSSNPVVTAPTQPLPPAVPASEQPPTKDTYQHPRSQLRALVLLACAIAGMLAILVVVRLLPVGTMPTAGTSATAIAIVSDPPVATTAPAKGSAPLETAMPEITPSSGEVAARTTATPTASETYVVKDGDSLSTIALRFGTTVEALLMANGLSDPNRIQTGQTLVIPANTAEPRLPTPPQLPSPTGLPTTVSTQQTMFRLEDSDWQGGYRGRTGQTYGGRSATWIYGTSTEYSTMRAVFILSGETSSAATLRIEGMDSEGPAKTPIQIDVNGTTIYSGDNPLPDDDAPLETGTWATYDFTIDPAFLQQGENEIRITNLAPGAFSRPPFFMLDYAELLL